MMFYFHYLKFFKAPSIAQDQWRQ